MKGNLNISRNICSPFAAGTYSNMNGNLNTYLPIETNWYLDNHSNI